MAWQTWMIIGLVILAYYQYTSPDKARELLKPVFGKVQEYLKSPFGNTNAPKDNSTADDSGIVCTDEINEVCGNGVTYTNSCEAIKAGVYQVTPGAC